MPARETEAEVGRRLEADGDRPSDLHLWQVGPGHRAVVLSIVTDRPRPPDRYKARRADLPELSHVTVEVQPCGQMDGESR